MNINKPIQRLHPLIAVAAVSVTVVSLMGIAALTGILPSSHGTATTASNLTSQNSYERAPAPLVAPVTGTEVVAHRNTVHHAPNYSHPPVGQTPRGEIPQQPAPIPVQQKQTAAPHNSPIGIGIGAVIGGFLGNQVGGGDGKTLATIAGAVGGGYLGNEVAKRNQ